MNKIQKLRAKTGLSQSQFAKAIQIPVSTLQAYEQGLRRIDGMSIDTAFKICQFCKIDINDFVLNLKK